MFGSDLYIALILGVLLSLIFAEKTGIVPAGLVVPGYLGLVFNQPVFILLVLLVSLLTYVIVKYGLSKFMILYGRRKFAAMLITGIVLKIAFDSLYPIVPFEIAEFRGIGIIVPRFNCQYHSETRFNHYVRKHAAIERSDLCYHVCLLLNLM